MPTYASLIADGVKGDNGMVQAFPPNTGVGWYTMATGAYPSEHGSTNNTFFRVGEGGKTLQILDVDESCKPLVFSGDGKMVGKKVGLNRDQLRLFTMGGGGAEGVCQLATHVIPDVWYEVRVRTEKSEHARTTFELLTAAGEVVDAATCTDLPVGAGAFTTLSVGSRSPFGATADVTVDDVAVHEEA